MKKYITNLVMLIVALHLASCVESTNANSDEMLEGKALELYSKAEDGDASAQYELAECYIEGIGCKINPQEAFKWYKKAADQGEVRALFNLGRLYYNGEGTPKNETLANEMFNKAFNQAKPMAEQGNSSAMWVLGFSYGLGVGGVSEDEKQMVYWWEKGADYGDRDCLLRLARYYGEYKEYAKAVNYLIEAANQGDPRAINNLGLYYKNGKGVARDYNKAVQLFTEAAGQGSSSAKSNLGLCYLDGVGVGKDYSKAVQLFKEAIAQGDESIKVNLGKCYAEGKGVEQDYAMAVQLYKEAGVDGCNDLGICYLEGKGVEQDYDMAIKLFKEAAQQKQDPKAIYNLAVCYEQGRGVEQDKAIALQLYQLSASLGDDEAKMVLREYGMIN